MAQRLVLLIHGIRTTAGWAEMVQKEIASGTDIVVVPVRYGFLDLVSFLLPGPTRSRAVGRVVREWRNAKTEYPDAKISILAHSFGTYAVCRILGQEGDLDLERLVLCGGIVRQDYRWDLVRKRVSEPPVNDCGKADIWPLLAASATWGYGASGVFGFGTVGVHDRFHPFGHSGYFDAAFVRRYWRSFCVDGSVVRDEWEPTRGPDPTWKPLLARAPLRWVAALGVAVALWFSSVALGPSIARLLGLGPQPVLVQRLELFPRLLRLYVGERGQLQAQISPPDPNQASPRVRWKSTDPAVVAISEVNQSTAEVTPQQSGTAWIRAGLADTLSDSARIEVLSQRRTTSIRPPEGLPGHLLAPRMVSFSGTVDTTVPPGYVPVPASAGSPLQQVVEVGSRTERYKVKYGYDVTVHGGANSSSGFEILRDGKRVEFQAGTNNTGAIQGVSFHDSTYVSGLEPGAYVFRVLHYLGGDSTRVRRVFHEPRSLSVAKSGT